MAFTQLIFLLSTCQYSLYMPIQFVRIFLLPYSDVQMGVKKRALVSGIQYRGVSNQTEKNLLLNIMMIIATAFTEK